MKKISNYLMVFTICVATILCICDTCKAAASEEVEVTASKASSFKVTIPKKITLNGENGAGTFTVKVEGDLAEGKTVTVQPDANFTMTQEGKDNITVAVTQEKTTFNASDFTLQADGTMSSTTTGTLKMSDISAGIWEGSFDFLITTNIDKLTDNSTESIQSTKVVTSDDFN